MEKNKLRKIVPILISFVGLVTITGFAVYLNNPKTSIDIETKSPVADTNVDETEKSTKKKKGSPSNTSVDSGYNYGAESALANQSSSLETTTNTTIDESKLPVGRYTSPVFNTIGSVKDITYSIRPAMKLVENSPTDYDLVDDPDNDVALKLNMYYPQNDPLTKRPLLIFVYGGGWWIGDRYQREADAEYYASLGYVTMTIDYTMFPGDTVLNPLPTADYSPYAKVMYESASDIFSAYQYAVSHKNVYAIDTARIGIGGWSAGGMISHILVHFNALPTPNGVKAVMGLSNILQADLATIFELSGGFKTFNSSFNPISMFASYDDDIGFAGTPNDHGADCAYLDSIGHDCVTVTYPGSGHELDFSLEPALSDSIPFFRQHVAGY